MITVKVRNQQIAFDDQKEAIEFFDSQLFAAQCFHQTDAAKYYRMIIDQVKAGVKLITIR